MATQAQLAHYQQMAVQAVSLAGIHPTMAAALGGTLQAMAAAPLLQTFRPRCGHGSRVFRSPSDVAAYEDAYAEACHFTACPHEPQTPAWLGWMDALEDDDRRQCRRDDGPFDTFSED